MTLGDGGQQRETLAYFRRHAADWNAKAESAGAAVDVIGQRNGYVLRLARRLEGLARAVDLGCGPGQLAIALAERGVHATGVDFADEMIVLARDNARKRGVRNCEFVHATVQDFTPAGDGYGLVSALGLIEYMAPDEVDRLLAKAAAMTVAGGALVVGSRNRLFNLFSLNDYTRHEMELGALGELMEEALAISEAPDMADCLAALRRRGRDLPAFECHAATGIDVSVRHQYTPAQLVATVERHGFTARSLSPAHFHGLTPRLKAAHPGVHKIISEGLHPEIVDAHFAVPTASTFMIEARRQ